MKKVRKFVRDQDIFGKQISLNFNRKGNTYQTSFGGCLSIMFYILMLAVSMYSYLNTQNHSKDVYQQTSGDLDIQSLGVVNMSESNLLLFLHIQVPYQISSLDQLESYIDVYFQQCQADTTKSQNCLPKPRLKARFCKQEDFGLSSDAVTQFSYFQNAILLCPDNNNGQDLQLEMNNAQTQFQRIDIKVDKCNNNTRENKNCQTENEIQSFLSNITIRLNQFYQKINLNKYDGEPYELKVSLVQVICPLGNSNFSQINNIFLQYNIYQTQDGLTNFGQITTQGQFWSVGSKVYFLKPFSNQQLASGDTRNLYRASIFLDNQQFFYQRQTYGILNACGDVGGIASIIASIISVLVAPLSELYFRMKMLHRLFVANTQKSQIFIPSRQTKKISILFHQNNHSQHQVEEQKEQIKNHHAIKLSIISQIKLFLAQYGIIYKILNKFCLDLQIFKSLIDKGDERIEKEMDIIKILRKIREFKYILRKINLNPNLKFELYHSKEYLIEIDYQDKKEKDFTQQNYMTGVEGYQSNTKDFLKDDEKMIDISQKSLVKDDKIEAIEIQKISFKNTIKEMTGRRKDKIFNMNQTSKQDKTQRINLDCKFPQAYISHAQQEFNQSKEIYQQKLYDQNNQLKNQILIKDTQNSNREIDSDLKQYFYINQHIQEENQYSNSNQKKD